LLYSVADAVPLGTALNVMLWFQLGLVLDASRASQTALGRSTHPHSKRAWLPAFGQWIPFIFLLMILCLIVVPWATLARAFSVNLASRMALTALLSDSNLLPAAERELARVTNGTCRANWLRGLVAEARGNAELKNSVWKELIGCDPRFVKLVRLADSSDLALAEAAVALQPAEAESYFWLAELRVPEAPVQAAQLYVRGLGLDPYNGLRWLELGNLVAETQPRMALDAYVNSCENGDPGANGCYRAGQVAEALGDRRSAIRYYRMSRWSAAISRAEQLEGLQEK
jgi:hypothetical protein